MAHELPPTTSRAGSTIDEQAAWRAYLDMHARLTRQLNREMQDQSGLSSSPDFAVLVQLSEHPDGRMRVLELARALRLGEEPALAPAHPDGTVAGCIDRSELQRRPPRRVRRAHAAGRAAVERAAPRARRVGPPLPVRRAGTRASRPPGRGVAGTSSQRLAESGGACARPSTSRRMRCGRAPR